MENRFKNQKLDGFAGDAVEYLNLRFDHLRLSVIEMLAVLISSGVATLVAVFFFAIGMIFIAALFVTWLATALGSWIAAFAVAGGSFLVLGLFFVVLRKHLFVNIMVGMLSKMLFYDQNDEA